jgi:SAM-dependent methyltransferase
MVVGPAWLAEILGASGLQEGEQLRVGPHLLEVQRGIPRAIALASVAQEQTAAAFGYKWAQRDTFDSRASLDRARDWLLERYGDIEHASWWAELGIEPLVVDVGCGAGMSALELFGSRLKDVRYLGVDISEAIDVARARFHERGLEPGLLQGDFTDLALPDGIADVVLAEGVLHHSDSTERALHAVARLLAPGGRLLFYVYATKGPVREFTDDHIRDVLQRMTPEEAWSAMMPLTRLGAALGELDVEIDIAEPIDLLGIPAGRVSVQRLVYWHVIKAFHHPDLTLDEMNHINFDWFAPRNAHRQTPHEVRAWCRDAGLEIEREVIEPAGITIIARRAGG